MCEIIADVSPNRRQRYEKDLYFVVPRKEKCKKVWIFWEKYLSLQRQTDSLATPLSAGSKTEPPLLHLKVTSGWLLFFVHLPEQPVEHDIADESAINLNHLAAFEYNHLVGIRILVKIGFDIGCQQTSIVVCCHVQHDSVCLTDRLSQPVDCG